MLCGVPRYIHQQLQPHAEETTCCSGQKPRAISASPILLSPGRLNNCQDRQPAPNATPTQGQQLTENSQQNTQQAATEVTTPSNQSVASTHALPSPVNQLVLPVQPAPYSQPAAPPGNKIGSPIVIIPL